jgi:hypothetical protein
MSVPARQEQNVPKTFFQADHTLSFSVKENKECKKVNLALE